MERAALMDVLAATWPVAETRERAPWRFQKSPGGGKRVNACVLLGDVGPDDVGRAEAELRAADQQYLFQVEEGSDLDTILAENGYSVVDETLLYQAPVAALAAAELPLVTAFPIWPPLQIMRDIWSAGGIGADRIAVMERARCDKSTIMGRVDGRAAGAVFVGLHSGCAMVHALEILADHRRKGLARNLMIAAARWGAARGATQIALLVTRQNAGANALYQSLGMVEEPGYHYRIKAE
ncbi:MAG: GNAT family N-acetyltransferase [Litoreibacter sp.]|nr:GNAT family N-acetyltransferase [Litoreibacter sp.]